jgi:hypothetical protein
MGNISDLIEKCCEAFDVSVISFNKYLTTLMLGGESAKALEDFRKKQEQLRKTLLELKDVGQ